MARFIAGPDGQIRDTQPEAEARRGIPTIPGLNSCLGCGGPLEERFTWNPFASQQVFKIWAGIFQFCFFLWVSWTEKWFWFGLFSILVILALMLALHRQVCPLCHEESSGQKASDHQIAEYRGRLETAYHIYNWFFH